MNWKKPLVWFAVIFAVSAASSTATWYVLTRHPAEEPPWKEVLDLNPEQAAKFDSIESEFNLALQDISVQDARNRIFLCSYLGEGLKKSEIKSATRKLTWVYEKKQERIAAALASLSDILTPEQRAVFSRTLMHRACESCRKDTGREQCLCGMCNLSS